MREEEKHKFQCLWSRCRDCGGLMYIDPRLGFGVICDCEEFENPPITFESEEE